MILGRTRIEFGVVSLRELTGAAGFMKIHEACRHCVRACAASFYCFQSRVTLWRLALLRVIVFTSIACELICCDAGFVLSMAADVPVDSCHNVGTVRQCCWNSVLFI